MPPPLPECCGDLVGAVASNVPAGNTTVATLCSAAGVLGAVGATVPGSRGVLQTVFAEADGLQPGKAQPAFFSPEKLILAALRVYDLRQCGRRNLGTLSQEWATPAPFDAGQSVRKRALSRSSSNAEE